MRHHARNHHHRNKHQKITHRNLLLEFDRLHPIEAKKAMSLLSASPSLSITLILQILYRTCDLHPTSHPEKTVSKREKAARQQGGLFFRENSSNGGKAIRTFWVAY